MRASCVLDGENSARSEAGRSEKDRRPVVIRLLQKAWAMDHAMKLCAAGDLVPADMAVLWFICTNMDNESGQAVRLYSTIAAGCGMSRSAVGRSLKRLKDAGVVEVTPRKARHCGQVASAFRLSAEAVAAKARPADAGAETDPGVPHVGRPPSPERDGHISTSHLLSFPNGRPRQSACKPEVDWMETQDWLAEAGKYHERWGYGSRDLAVSDLDRWRSQKGDARILKAIETARAKGLYGAVLIDFLEKTWLRRSAAAT